MIPIATSIDGKDILDIGWGVIVPQTKGGGTGLLYLVPREELTRSWAVVYIATETGKCQGIYYVMTVDEARRFVTDPRTTGFGRGSHWAYFYTTLENFFERGGVGTARFTHDTGKMDEVLAELDIHPLTKEEILALIDACGYRGASGLMPGVIYEVDGRPVDIDTEGPRDITGAVIKLDQDGHKYRCAVHEGWCSRNSNLGVEVVWRDPVTITYDNRYR